MKSTFHLSIITICLFLSSCGIGSRNFQKQKFTNLKSIKSSYEVNESSTLAFSEDEALNEVVSMYSQDQVELDDEDPKVSLIKTAIDNGQTIVIHHGEKQYRVKDPIYDAFYNNLFGELVEVPSDIKFDSALEFELDEQKPLAESDGIAINDLVQLQKETIEPKEVIEDVKEEDEIKSFKRPTFKERKKWPEITKEEQKKSPLATRAKTFFGLGFLTYLVSLIGFMLLLTSGGLLPIVILVLSGIYYLIMNLIAFINIINYKKKMNKKKKRMRSGMRLMYGLLFAGFVWLGIMIIQYGLLVLI